MLLKSSLLILVALSIFFNNLKILLAVFLIVFLLNIFFNKNKKKYIKRIKIILFFYLTTFLVQLYYTQEGEVLYKIYEFYITKAGVLNFGLNFIRIINLILLSWLINEVGFFKGKLKRYQEIIDTVIELVPQVFVLFKKRMKLKFFYRHIIKSIKTKEIFIEEDC